MFQSNYHSIIGLIRRHCQRRLICVLLLWFLALAAIGQSTLNPPLSKDEKLMYDEAKKAAWHGEYEKSNQKYLGLLKKRPDLTEARLRVAANFYSMGNKEESERHFIKVIQQFPDFDNEMYFSLAMVQADLKKFGAAADNYEIYACREKNNPEKVRKALERKDIMRFRDRAMQSPVPFSPVPAGPGINTLGNEYSPWLAINGSSLIFTRNEGQEDIYISRKDSAGFSAASPMFELNTPFDEGAFSLSADGSIIVFTTCNRRDVFGSCDLYYSLYREDRWTPVANMGKIVNSAAWDSQPSLSADGRWLVFSSRRLGTRGGADIFYTYRDSTHAWVTPKNMGDSLNTTGDEESPFLHPDGQTLYFRSNGWPGMGGHDVFVSRRNPETGQWSKAENIGYPINTEGSEGGFSVSLDGSTAYMATDVVPGSGKKTGQLDIYSFQLYEAARPRPTILISGRVTDAGTGTPLAAHIRLVCLQNNETLYSATLQELGTFFVPATAGYSYAFIADHPGYAYSSVHADLRDSIQTVITRHVEIPLYRIPQETVSKKDSISRNPVVMENVFFALNSAKLRPESIVEISTLADLLLDNPELQVILEGHTDDTGDDSFNTSLSKARAEAVADVLRKRGVQMQRIQTEGKGSSEPIASNKTAEGRKKNRRTVFRLQYLP